MAKFSNLVGDNYGKREDFQAINALIAKNINEHMYQITSKIFIFDKQSRSVLYSLLQISDNVDASHLYTTERQRNQGNFEDHTKLARRLGPRGWGNGQGTDGILFGLSNKSEG